MTGKQPVPCTLAEVEDLEQWTGHRLPEVYREFLLWMGHAGGGLLEGSDCFYPHLRELPLLAQDLLEEDQCVKTLPGNTVVFFMHQGYQFDFFYLNDGDDPPVYWYLEDEPIWTSFPKLYDHFSDFVATELEGHIKVQQSLLNRNDYE